ncbi:M42 family peptidase [Eubacteriales bacterium OttesenSCG-928-G02]|nr:M42 family peptidase [Eubacteriales bacterium OttesenSCG-928-G02]
MFELLQKLCNAFGPSGHEDKVREIIIEEIKSYATSYRIDSVGNLIAFKKGKKSPDKKILFSAHMDEVGFMATHITENGFIRFGAIGGIDKRVLSAERLIFENGTKGVISSKAIHLKPLSERGLCLPINKMQIDIGSLSYNDTINYVNIGDVAVFNPNYSQFGDGYICSKAVDDRFGCMALCELIKKDLEFDAYFAFCVCEEVGCRGAKGVAFSEKADYVIVVEATTAGDIHGVSKPAAACVIGEGPVLSFMDGSTLYEQKLIREIKSLAEDHEINCQYKTTVAGGNDASVYQRSALAAKVIAVSLPTRYLHTASTVAAKSDITNTIMLLEKIINRGFKHD